MNICITLAFFILYRLRVSCNCDSHNPQHVNVDFPFLLCVHVCWGAYVSVGAGAQGSTYMCSPENNFEFCSLDDVFPCSGLAQCAMLALLSLGSGMTSGHQHTWLRFWGWNLAPSFSISRSTLPVELLLRLSLSFLSSQFGRGQASYLATSLLTQPTPGWVNLSQLFPSRQSLQCLLVIQLGEMTDGLEQAGQDIKSRNKWNTFYNAATALGGKEILSCVEVTN